ncbi:signal peptidase I [Frigoribacterium sp. PhB160]|uniref:signal peptidase I n=1 Tax=Frigoribacterium sp. PhB160 TaxID=2485192 RepID=UPI000F950B4F|nr:signal peptidase I [Frigoribacterium sp. PhB160]ROS60987.1 signal peptidase I [Frigoribacterium sp. PhB160]
MTTFDLLQPATAAQRIVGSRGASRSWPHWLRLVVGVVSRTVLGTLVGLLLWAAVPAVIGWTPTTVMTGSMEPRIHPGDVVVAKPVAETEIHRGQVLLFQDPDHADHLRLHRYDDNGQGTQIITKGDANPAADSTPIDRSAVVGVGYLRVPYLGTPFVWAQSHQFGHLLVTGGVLLLLLLGARADGYLRRAATGTETDATADEEAPRASRRPVAHQGGRAERRRLDRRRRRLRAAAGTFAVVGVASGLALTLVVSGGAGAAFSAPTTNPTSTLAASTSFDCLSPTITDSPVFAWGYNEASGTTTADSGSAGRTGTLSAGVSRVGGTCSSSPYVTLNGTSGQVTSSAAAVAAPSAFTLETWVNLPTTSTGGKIVGFGNQASGLSGAFDRHLYVSSTGVITFGVYNAGTKTISTPKTYRDGAWHHVVATMGANGMVLYVDGVSVGTNANKAAEANNGYWRVGYDNLSGWPNAPTAAANYWLAGSLDDTAVYTTALSAATVTAHFQDGR